MLKYGLFIAVAGIFLLGAAWLGIRSGEGAARRMKGAAHMLWTLNTMFMASPPPPPGTETVVRSDDDTGDDPDPDKL